MTAVDAERVRVLVADDDEVVLGLYRHILARVVRGMAREHGFEVEVREQDALAESIGSWPPFADTVGALPRLQRHFRLGVISNIDDDLFAATRERLGVAFDWVLTAEEAASYKPMRRNFELAIRKAEADPSRWLHVAQSLYHDIVPARELEMTTIWVNRRRGRQGFGATPPVVAMPDLEVADLDELVRLVEASR